MSLIGSLWTRLVAAIEGEATTVEAVFTDLEKKLLPGFSALIHKIEKTIGEQGLTLLNQGLADIATIMETGGSISDAVAKLVPQVIAQAASDLKQDAATATHGALNLLIAELPTPPAANAAAPAAEAPKTA